MTDLLRQEIATSSDTIVVKVGSRVLTAGDTAPNSTAPNSTASYNTVLDEQRIESLAQDLSGLIDTGHKVVLVSSGAVSAGMGRLKIRQRPAHVSQLQALAAIGQSRLIETYERAFGRHNRHAAQLLLTADDMNDRQRYLNVRNTILTLLEMGAVPIINENDTVSVDELLISFGDNDHLAAIVTNLIRAPLLVILSDVDGLYDGDPHDEQSNVISTVTQVNDEVMGLVCDEESGLSKGGMASKLAAAKMLTTAGENVIIANGRTPDVLGRIMRGETIGTLLLAEGKSMSPWKRWIGFSVKPRGRLVVDHGARRALETNGRSLLPIGIVDVEGEFEKGDVVALCDPSGEPFARGLTNYPSREILCIKGLQTGQISHVLGRCPYDEVIHRNNMAITS